VIDLPSEAAPVEPARVDDEPTAIAKRPRRALALALGVVALAVMPGAWIAYGESFDYRALRVGAAAPAAPVAAIVARPSVTAPPPSAAVSASAAPSVAPAAAAPAPASAAPSVVPAAATPPVVSSAAVPARLEPKAKPAARPRLKRSGVPDRADYGI
jgi:hypothetical protein